MVGANSSLWWNTPRDVCLYKTWALQRLENYCWYCTAFDFEVMFWFLVLELNKTRDQRSVNELSLSTIILLWRRISNTCKQ